MITLYDGTPGSGKSLDVMRAIIQKLKKGGNIIANFPIATENIKGMRGKFIFKENKDLTVKFLYDFAFENHKKGKEGQTCIIWDECQAVFNPRDFARGDRREYNDFFSLHRHLGYNVILITQNDRLIDRQIRCLIEYRVKHRKLNNFGTIGLLLPVKVFMCIEYWYGVNEKLSSSVFVCTKKLTRMYDSYSLFDQIKERKLNEVKVQEQQKKDLKEFNLLQAIKEHGVLKNTDLESEKLENIENLDSISENFNTIELEKNVNSILLEKEIQEMKKPNLIKNNKILLKKFVQMAIKILTKKIYFKDLLTLFFKTKPIKQHQVYTEH